MIRNLFNIPKSSFDTSQFVLAINTSRAHVDSASDYSQFNLPHTEAVINLLIHNYQSGGYRGHDVLVATPDAAQCTRYKRAFSRLSVYLPEEYCPSVGNLRALQYTKTKVLIFDFTTTSIRRPPYHMIYDMFLVADSKEFDIRIDVCPLRTA